MKVEVVDRNSSEVDAGLVCVGFFEDEELPAPLADLPGAKDVKPGFRKLTLLRPEKPERVLVVGLGKRGELDRERMRVAGALGIGIGFGPVYAIGPNLSMGDEMNRASKLGEDTARGGETLITEAAREALGERPGVRFHPQSSDDLLFSYFTVLSD